MCLLPAPMDGVPYPQPLAGPEPQYVPWGVLLVRPIGHPPRSLPPRAADQRSRAYHTLLRVLRWGRYGHWGGPQTPEVGFIACVSRGPYSSRPPFPMCGLRWWVSRLSRVGWWWWGALFAFLWPCCLCACPHLPWLWFAVGVCVCGAVRARMVSVRVCVSCVRGGAGVGVSSVCVGVCVCVLVCSWGQLGLAAGVGVGLVGVCRGWPLATPGRSS